MASTSENVVLIYNAKIWSSLGVEKSWFTFDSTTGVILEIGDCNPPMKTFSPSKKHDYHGKRILPGFHDAHIHVTLYGLSISYLQLHGVTSFSEMQSKIADYKRKNPTEWIVGMGWEQDLLGHLPNKCDIDEVCPDMPVILLRVCLHIAVINSKAMEIIGITADTRDPPGGQIDRYPVDHQFAGQPTGVVRETAAMSILENFVKPSEKEKKVAIKTALQKCLQNGTTSVHAIEEGTWKLFCELADAGELPIRVFYSAYYSGRNDEGFPRAGEVRGEMLSCDRIKIFTDGGVGASTAALSENYRCQHHSGILVHTQDELTELVREADDRGYRLEIHVIGDRAADSALTAIEAVDIHPKMRPVLTHCQILREDLIKRMVQRGAVATIQPQFVTNESASISSKLPEHLLDYAYAWKSMRDAGIVCGGSSDAPVESPEPLLGMYDAVFRPIGHRNPISQSTYRSQECLTISEAIDLYTSGGAFVTCKERTLGRLMPGYQADFVVMDGPADICDKPSALLSAQIQEVWVAGKRTL